MKHLKCTIQHYLYKNIQAMLQVSWGYMVGFCFFQTPWTTPLKNEVKCKM